MLIKETYENSYEQLLAAEMYNQQQVIRFARECVYLENGDIEGLISLNEGIVDGIKQIIQKIVDSVKGMFKKFNAKIGSLTKDHAAYCAKYKDYIVNTTKYPPVSRDITGYVDYDMNLVRNEFVVPEFSFDSAEFKNMCNKEEGGELNDGDFIDKYGFASKFKNGITYKKGDANTGSLKDCIIKSCTKDDDKSLDFKDLNFQELYEYIQSYEATKNTLDTDEKTYDANHTKINDVLDQLEKDANEAKTAKEAKDAKAKEVDKAPKVSNSDGNGEKVSKFQQDYDSAKRDYEEANRKATTNQDTAQQDALNENRDKAKTKMEEIVQKSKNAGDPVAESSMLYFSTVYGTINEVNVGKVKGDTSGSTVTSNTNSYNAEDIAKHKDAASNAVGNNAENKDYDAILKNIEKYKKGAKLFFTCCGQVIAAKLEMIETYEKQTYTLLVTRIQDHVSPASPNNKNNIDAKKNKTNSGVEKDKAEAK